MLLTTSSGLNVYRQSIAEGARMSIRTHHLLHAMSSSLLAYQVRMCVMQDCVSLRTAKNQTWGKLELHNSSILCILEDFASVGFFCLQCKSVKVSWACLQCHCQSCYYSSFESCKRGLELLNILEDVREFLSRHNACATILISFYDCAHSLWVLIFHWVHHRLKLI